jgi:hypothetical protein
MEVFPFHYIPREQHFLALLKEMLGCADLIHLFIHRLDQQRTLMYWQK